ncbi:MAG: hypothetical protein ACREIA_15130 [Opitutaceae bacterium]
MKKLRDTILACLRENAPEARTPQHLHHAARGQLGSTVSRQDMREALLALERAGEIEPTDPHRWRDIVPYRIRGADTGAPLISPI